MNKKEAALNKAMTIIEFGFQFEKVLKMKLKKAGFMNEEIGFAVGRLKQMDLINDFKFAHNYAESLINNKLTGPVKVTAKLTEKGLDYGVAMQITSNIIELAGGEEHILRKFLEKNSIDITDFKDAAEKDKIVRKLTAKGFTAKTIFRTMNIDEE